MERSSLIRALSTIDAYPSSHETRANSVPTMHRMEDTKTGTPPCRRRAATAGIQVKNSGLQGLKILAYCCRSLNLVDFKVTLMACERLCYMLRALIIDTRCTAASTAVVLDTRQLYTVLHAPTAAIPTVLKYEHVPELDLSSQRLRSSCTAGRRATHHKHRKLANVKVCGAQQTRGKAERGPGPGRSPVRDVLRIQVLLYAY